MNVRNGFYEQKAVIGKLGATETAGSIARQHWLALPAGTVAGSITGNITESMRRLGRNVKRGKLMAFREMIGIAGIKSLAQQLTVVNSTIQGALHPSAHAPHPDGTFVPDICPYREHNYGISCDALNFGLA